MSYLVCREKYSKSDILFITKDFNNIVEQLKNNKFDFIKNNNELTILKMNPECVIKKKRHLMKLDDLIDDISKVETMTIDLENKQIIREDKTVVLENTSGNNAIFK